MLVHSTLEYIANHKVCLPNGMGIAVDFITRRACRMEMEKNLPRQVDGPQADSDFTTTTHTQEGTY